MTIQELTAERLGVSAERIDEISDEIVDFSEECEMEMEEVFDFCLTKYVANERIVAFYTFGLMTGAIATEILELWPE